jgi:hypothetical protein
MARLAAGNFENFLLGVSEPTIYFSVLISVSHIPAAAD